MKKHIWELHTTAGNGKRLLLNVLKGIEKMTEEINLKPKELTHHTCYTVREME